MYADVYDDIVEVCGTDLDSDEVVTQFATEGRTLEEVAAHLEVLFGQLVTIPITDWRGAQP
jgi:hypothetical protein